MMSTFFYGEDRYKRAKSLERNQTSKKETNVFRNNSAASYTIGINFKIMYI